MFAGSDLGPLLGACRHARGELVTVHFCARDVCPAVPHAWRRVFLTGAVVVHDEDEHGSSCAARVSGEREAAKPHVTRSDSHSFGQTCTCPCLTAVRGLLAG